MQSKVKLTDAVVARATLPDGKTELTVWDTEVTGFGLRLRGNSRSYVVAYRPSGKGRSADMKRVKIGTPETIKTASEARRLAFAALGKVAAGGDPAKDRAEEKRRAKARVADLLDRYEEDLTRRNYVARKMVMSVLRRGLKRHLEKDISEVKGADLAAVMEGLERAGQVGAADAFRSRSRAFLAFCVTKAKVLDANPLYGFRRQRATRADRLAKQDHGRALSDEELAAVWLASSAETSFGRFVRFLVLTGCRRTEGAFVTRTMLRGSESKGYVVDFPAAFVKQGRGHAVTVTPQLRRLLDACPVDGRAPDLFFPSARTGGQMSGWNKLKARLVKSSGVAFTFHDLRRTFRTGLSALGIDTETAELALGHARENLIEIYDRGGGSAQVRKAFDLWADHVETIVQAELVKRAANGAGFSQ